MMISPSSLVLTPRSKFHLPFPPPSTAAIPHHSPTQSASALLSAASAFRFLSPPQRIADSCFEGLAPKDIQENANAELRTKERRGCGEVSSRGARAGRPCANSQRAWPRPQCAAFFPSVQCWTFDVRCSLFQGAARRSLPISLSAPLRGLCVSLALRSSSPTHTTSPTWRPRNSPPPSLQKSAASRRLSPESRNSCNHERLRNCRTLQRPASQQTRGGG